MTNIAETTPNFKIITGSDVVIFPKKVESFQIVQDNRPKTVHHAVYEHKVLGMRDMYFMNGNEAIINGRGRYVLTKSPNNKGAVLIDLSKVEEEKE
jgi:hypothetical protein